MFARRSAAKVFSDQQHARVFIAWMVEDKRICRCRRFSPVVEEKLSKPCFLDALQELLGNDLISIDIYSIERCHATFMYAKRFHKDPFMCSAGAPARVSLSFCKSGCPSRRPLHPRR